MELRILGSYGGRLPGKNTTSFLIDGTILVDAGSATAALTVEELRNIETILVSHSHLDHIYDIGLYCDIVVGPPRPATEVIGIDHTIQALQRDFLNNVIWPDFSRLPTAEDPVLQYRTEMPGKPFKVGKYEVEFVEVSHTIPCVGMLFRWDGGSFLYTADTGPTEKAWAMAAAEENLKGLITEISFPNAMKDLSLLTGHMSPCHIDEELAKIGRDDIPVYIYHFKPAFEDQLQAEMDTIKYPNIRPLVQGETILL